MVLAKPGSRFHIRNPSLIAHAGPIRKNKVRIGIASVIGTMRIAIRMWATARARYICAGLLDRRLQRPSRLAHLRGERVHRRRHGTDTTLCLGESAFLQTLAD